MILCCGTYVPLQWKILNLVTTPLELNYYLILIAWTQTPERIHMTLKGDLTNVL